MFVCVGRARGCDIGQPSVHTEVMEEVRELRARLEAMEIDRPRDTEEGDVSEPEDEEKREEAAPM